MTDLLIANPGTGWDLVIRDGDLVMTEDEGRPQEVVQRVIYRLMTWLGESIYDRSAGSPYLDTVFGFEPVPGVVALLTQIIRETEGVDEIVDEPEFDLDQQTRVLSIFAVIRVSGEDVEIDITIRAVAA